MFVHPTRKCVYGHYVNGRLIYIGAGTAFRALSRAKRNDKWKTLTSNGYDAKILVWYADIKTAKDAELRLIRCYKPECNLVGNGYSSAWGNKYNLGRQWTTEQKKKQSEIQKHSWEKTKRFTGRRRPIRPIRCIETGIIYQGLREAARKTGAHFTCISGVINGKIRAAAGLRFERVEG
jgi:hypothetical protein